MILKKKVSFAGVLLFIAGFVISCWALNVSVAADNIDLVEEFDVLVTVPEYAEIDLNSSTIMLDVFLEEGGTQSADVNGHVRGNIPMAVTLSQEPEEFGNKLDDWIEYNYQLGNLETKFDSGDNSSSTLTVGSGEYDLDIETVFDADQALNEEWWELAADTYSDTILLITVAAN
ncbi:MAG: hypothetical protein ACOC4G_06635 [Bacillota bacterium]